MTTRPFALTGPSADRLTRLFGPLGRSVPERVLAFPALNELYSDISCRRQPGSFAERALASLDVRIDVSDTDLTQIPKTGPLIVVANHPFGGVDGLALATLLRRVRPDVKLLANHLLGRIPELRDSLLLVDPFEGDGAARRNLSPLRAAMRWVRDGGALGIFPAGEVSRLELSARGVIDAPWSTTAARIAAATGAPVLPIFFDGRNSALFQLAGLIHPRLRTALLP